MKPIRCTAFFGASSIAVTFTIGLPALAMMKDSPFAALSTKRDRWVLASWMLIVSMTSLQ